MIGKPIDILLVEDDPGDVDLTIDTLEESKIKVKLNVVEDGVKALAYLRQEDQYASASRPDLILLDLNLPRKNGHEVLQEIKNDPILKLIPVIILTTSDSEKDIVETYNLGANCYVTKPVGLEQFSDVVKSINEFWFTVVKLPPSTRL